MLVYLFGRQTTLLQTLHRNQSAPKNRLGEKKQRKQKYVHEDAHTHPVELYWVTNSASPLRNLNGVCISFNMCQALKGN